MRMGKSEDRKVWGGDGEQEMGEWGKKGDGFSIP